MDVPEGSQQCRLAKRHGDVLSSYGLSAGVDDAVFSRSSSVL